IAKPIAKVTVSRSAEVEPDRPEFSSDISLSPGNKWTGAPLHPKIPSNEAWARIEAPIGDLAVDITSERELRWASPAFSATQPPFTEGGIVAVVWSHDGNHVFTAGSDGYVRAFKAPTNEEILAQGIPSLSPQPLTSLDLSIDGVHLAIGDALGR